MIPLVATSLLALGASALNITAYSYAGQGSYYDCNETHVEFFSNYSGYQPGECNNFDTVNPVTSVKGYTDFLSAYWYVRFFPEKDCQGFGIGVGGGSPWPVPDGQCIESYPYNSTFGSWSYTTFR